MKEYWTDPETEITHKILFDGDNYIVVDEDTTIYLDAEDVFEEEDYPEEPLTEEELWEIECDKRYDAMIDKMMCGELY